MTTTTTNSLYMQPSQNGGIHGNSPLSKPTYGDFDDDESDADEFVAAGRRDPEVYERTLQSWRAAIRRPIVRMVEKESHAIAAMQVLRSPLPPKRPWDTRPNILTMFAPPFAMVIGPTEDAVAGRLLRVHFELGNSHVLYDRSADLLLLRPE